MTAKDTGWLSEIQVRYPLITETALSPDGCRAVYGVREPLMTEDESRYLTHLYLTPVEGGGPFSLPGDGSPTTQRAGHRMVGTWRSSQIAPVSAERRRRIST